MKRIDGRPVGIDQGSLMLFEEFATGGPMWSGEGQREVRRRVRFSERFGETPAVMVGISLWDASCEANLRADIRAEAVAREGFEIVFATWGDSRIARIRADWTAIGPLGHPDDWDV